MHLSPLRKLPKTALLLELKALNHESHLLIVLEDVLKRYIFVVSPTSLQT
jgi:hypothetical protein